MGPLELILRQSPAWADKATRQMYKKMLGTTSLENRVLMDKINKLYENTLTPNEEVLKKLQRQQRPKGMQESNLNTAYMAGIQHMDPDAELLLAPLEGRGDKAAASMIFRPGYNDEFNGISPGSIYIEGLSSEVPGGGTALLKELEKEYPGHEFHLESLAYPETMDFYRRKGFVEVPLVKGTNPIEGTAPFFVKPHDVKIKKEGGSVNGYAGGGKVGALGRVARHLMGEEEPARRGIGNIIKEKGGNWLSGSVEGALGGLKKRVDPELEGYFRRGQNMMPGERAEVATKIPINDWIDKQLTRYVKNDMATEGDPIRALAERGVLHFVPDNPPGVSSLTMNKRKVWGQKPFGEANSPMAKEWENLADDVVFPETAFQRGLAAEGSAKEMLDKIAARDPMTPVYDIGSNRGRFNSETLGFNHLIDELSNAINPDSGLPRHLQFPADRLDKVSVPQAVERVAQINAWRAEQAKLADLAKMKANLLAKPHKEYETGWRWAELPDADTLEGAKLIKDIGCQGGWCTQGEGTAKHYGSHKAGNKLYALIDAEGRPHVQIHSKTNPPKSWKERMSSEEYSDIFNKAMEELGFVGEEHLEDSKKLKALQDTATALALEKYGKAEPTMSISQIKPFSNSWDSQMVRDFEKKNPNYRKELEPMIQDFVKSGKWSDVGDLQNAGLRRSRDVWNDLEQQKIRAAGKEFGEYLSPEEMKAINAEVWPGDATYNFAKGGSVKKPIAGGVPRASNPLDLTVSLSDVDFGNIADAITAERAKALESNMLAVARRKEDARNRPIAQQFLSDGKNFITPEERSEKAREAIERGLVWGTGLPAALAVNLPAMTLRAGLIANAPGAVMQAAGERDPEAAQIAAGLGALGVLGTKAIPLALGVGAAHAGDAEAGEVKKLLQMMYRGRSSFTPLEDRAMFMSPSKSYAAEYANRRVSQLGGDKKVDSYLVDPFNVERRGHNMTPEAGGNIQSNIAYPKKGEAVFIGTEDFANGGSVENTLPNMNNPSIIDAIYQELIHGR